MERHYRRSLILIVVHEHRNRQSRESALGTQTLPVDAPDAERPLYRSLRSHSGIGNFHPIFLHCDVVVLQRFRGCMCGFSHRLPFGQAEAAKLLTRWHQPRGGPSSLLEP
jgi:hypothetical protein